MPLILWVTESLSLEDVSKMTTAVIADNLSPHHAQARVRSLTDGAWNSVPECRPPAARVELVVRFVEGRVAAGACVHAGIRIVLIVLARAGHFGPFLAENTELLCGLLVLMPLDHGVLAVSMRVPGDSWACHSPSVF